MRGCRADLEFEPVARVGLLCAGRAAADNGMCSGLQVEIGFRTHGLDDIHHGLEAVVGRGLSWRNEVAILGPDAEDDIFAGVTGGSFAVTELIPQSPKIDILKPRGLPTTGSTY